MRCRFTSCAFALLSFFATFARAADGGDNWPRFRGPNGAGISETPAPVKWTDKDFAWRIELPGEGHSSPVVWDKDVFVTAADDGDDGGKRTLLCVSVTKGVVRWKHEVDFKSYHKHGENSFASSTPAVDEKYVYVQWNTQDDFDVYAVRRSDGGEAWHAELGKYVTQHGGGGSPIVLGGLVFVNVDQDKPGSFVAALDRETGDVRWRTPRDSTKFSTSTPCVYRPPGKNAKDELIFATNANGLCALDPATGHTLWEVPDAFEARVVSSPIVAGPQLIIGACGEGGRGLSVVAVKPPEKDGDEPDVAYKLTQEMPYVPTPIVYKDRLFTWSDAGVVTCSEVTTGKQIWQDKIKAQFFGSPIVAGGKLYGVSKKGEVFVLDATAEKFKQLAKNPLGEATSASPAASGGRLFFHTVNHLVCVAPSDRKSRE